MTVNNSPEIQSVRPYLHCGVVADRDQSMKIVLIQFNYFFSMSEALTHNKAYFICVPRLHLIILVVLCNSMQPRCVTTDIDTLSTTWKVLIATCLPDRLTRLQTSLLDRISQVPQFYNATVITYVEHNPSFLFFNYFIVVGIHMHHFRRVTCAHLLKLCLNVREAFFVGRQSLLE